MSLADPHPADGEKPQEHPPVHEHTWMQHTNEWGEPTYSVCTGCGATKPG